MTGLELLAGAGLGLAADGLKHGVNLLRQGDFAIKLAKKTIEEAGGPLRKKPLRKWLYTPVAWELLGSLDPSNDDQVLSELHQLVEQHPNRKSRRLLGADRDRYLQTVLCRLRANFLATLDEPYARALTHERQERNFERLHGAIEDQRGRHELDPELLGRTPPGVEEVLMRMHTLDQGRSALLLKYLTDNGPNHDAVELLVSSPPDWIVGSPPEAWVAIAYHASAHGHSDVAASAFKKARIEGADDRTHALLARQALSYQGIDEAEGLKLLDDDIDDPVQLLAGARLVLEETPLPLTTLWSDSFEFPDSSTKHFASSMKFAGYFHIKRYGDARRVAEEMIETVGERPWNLHHRALALAALADDEPFGSHEHQQLLSQALASVRAAISATHRWAGPTLEQTRFALRAALATRQPEVIIALGAAPPHGSADADVSADPEVRNDVAIAYLQLGDFDEAARIGRESSDSYIEKIAAAARLIENDPTESAALFREALDAATTIEQSVGAAAGLASLGVDLGDLEQIEQKAPHYVALLRADQLVARGEDADALRALDDAEDGIPRRQRVARCQLRLGDHLAAARTLLDAGIELRHARSTIDGADILLDHGQHEAAEDALRHALAAVPAIDLDDYQIRARLMQLCIDRQDWNELEHLARAALEVNPQRPEAHWALVDAHFHNGRIQRAYQQLRSRPDLDVHDEYSAVRKIDLLNRMDPGVESAIETLELAERFKTSEAVRAIALAATRSLNSIEGLPDHVAERAKTQWKDFFEDFPASDAFTKVAIPEDGDVEAIVAALRPMLEPRARMLDDLANQCRTGQLPIGMFAHLAGVPYASVCMNGGPDGTFLAVAGNEWLTDVEIDHAGAHLGSNLVLDTTAIATAIRTNNAWMLNRGAENVVTTATAIDARNAETFMSETTDHTLAWSLDTDRPQVSDTDHDQLAATLERVRALVALVGRFKEHHVPASQLPGDLNELPDELMSAPWIASLALAHQLDVPLVSDDHVHRTLARQLGVTTFGTYAVINAQHRITPKSAIQLTSELDALVTAGHVDLPGGVDRMVRIANHDQGKPHTAAMLLSRPATWREDPPAVLAFRSQVLEYLASNDRLEEIPWWTAAAALGYALVLQPHLRARAVADQLVSAIMTVGPDRAPTPDMLAAARSVLRRAGLDPAGDDPLPHAVRSVRDFITDFNNFPPSVIGPLVLRTFRDLEERDRAIVLDVLLGVS